MLIFQLASTKQTGLKVFDVRCYIKTHVIYNVCYVCLLRLICLRIYTYINVHFRFPFSILISSILTFIWCQLLSIPIQFNEYKNVAVMYGASAVIELLSEPIWLISQMNLMVKLRAIVEAFSLFIRICLSTVLYFKWPGLGLYAFGISQIIYSIFISGSYFVYFKIIFSKQQHKEFLISSESISSYSDLFPNIYRVNKN